LLDRTQFFRNFVNLPVSRIDTIQDRSKNRCIPGASVRIAETRREFLQSCANGLSSGFALSHREFDCPTTCSSRIFGGISFLLAPLRISTIVPSICPESASGGLRSRRSPLPFQTESAGRTRQNPDEYRQTALLASANLRNLAISTCSSSARTIRTLFTFPARESRGVYRLEAL